MRGFQTSEPFLEQYPRSWSCGSCSFVIRSRRKHSKRFKVQVALFREIRSKHSRSSSTVGFGSIEPLDFSRKQIFSISKPLTCKYGPSDGASGRSLVAGRPCPCSRRRISTSTTRSSTSPVHPADRKGQYVSRGRSIMSESCGSSKSRRDARWTRSALRAFTGVGSSAAMSSTGAGGPPPRALALPPAQLSLCRHARTQELLGDAAVSTRSTSRARTDAVVIVSDCFVCVLIV